MQQKAGSRLQTAGIRQQAAGTVQKAAAATGASPTPAAAAAATSATTAPTATIETSALDDKLQQCRYTHRESRWPDAATERATGRSIIQKASLR